MKNVFAWLFCDLVWVLLLHVLVLWHVGVLSWYILAFKGFTWGDKIYLRAVVRQEGLFGVHLNGFIQLRDDLSRDVNYPQSALCRKLGRSARFTNGGERISFPPRRNVPFRSQW